MTRSRSLVALAGVLALLLGGCAGADDADKTAAPVVPTDSPSAGHAGHGATGSPAAAVPLREGESRITIAMPKAYQPSAPTGIGTDDYRCFLLDPALDHDAFITGTDVQPGNPDVVHHVILFRVPPGKVADAERLDAVTDGPGWTCFGNSGIPDNFDLGDAPWLGAWAPGGSESVVSDGLGVPLARGTGIVMQVHYNLLQGRAEDVSAARLRIMPASAELTPLRTMLLPAPVELPCRPRHRDGPLCDRERALADVRSRFGAGPGSTADLLHFLCGAVDPGPVQSCTVPVQRRTTVRGVAGHMHLLGRSITITANPSTPREKVLLDVPVWNFDDQGAVRIDPFVLRPGDRVQVTCRHVQWLRDHLPSFAGQPDRYVLWGDGTTDEMCLGLLQVTHP